MINKLQIDYDFSFELVGIVANLKEYKLAWLLNKAFQWHFVKRPDYHLVFIKRPTLLVSHYFYQTTNDFFTLYKNRALTLDTQSQAFFVPELKQFDYLLKIENNTETISVEQLVETIRGFNGVQFAGKIPLASVKEKDNFILD